MRQKIVLIFSYRKRVFLSNCVQKTSKFLKNNVYLYEMHKNIPFYSLCNMKKIQ